MSLKHVLLVVLKKRNSTGYEITKWFDGPLGHFWNTSHQRVYRALATLYKDGWVDYEEIQQDDKPNKKVYELTAIGEEALRKWLDTPLKPQPINEAFLVKLFAGNDADRKLLYDELLRQYEEHESLMEDYKKIEQEFFSDGFTGNAENDMMYLTLRRGFYHEEACIGWSKEAIGVLEKLL